MARRRTVTLYHATPVTNLPSIKAEGLSPDYATGKIHAVWLCTPGLLGWAVDHAAARHGTHPECVAVLAVRVRSDRLTRFRRGRYYAKHTMENIRWESLCLPRSATRAG